MSFVNKFLGMDTVDQNGKMNTQGRERSILGAAIFIIALLALFFTHGSLIIFIVTGNISVIIMASFFKSAWIERKKLYK